MISLDEIKKYLPQYLTSDSQRKLFEELKSFPENIDQRFYSRELSQNATIFQGDGVNDLLVINLPDLKVRPTPSIVLSNTCDVDLKNERLFESRVVYAPIFQLSKYKRFLVKENVELGKCSIGRVEKHIEAIKKQFVTQILYLPQGLNLKNDRIVFLDRLNNCPIKSLYNIGKMKDKKIFTLSDLGFYVFLIKLSIHFTRIREGIERPVGNSVHESF